MATADVQPHAAALLASPVRRRLVDTLAGRARVPVTRR